ncbi:hypothetical protein [Algihabitans albus]|uniref:hypothetical protein n=1 Tax=Algihabitans albus TaxID=2164067 RepID=UPI000E5D98A5|nr:hypothetical protein [Algihabitans albus]
MTSAALVGLYEDLRDLPWESLSLDGTGDAFPYRLVGRLAEKQITIMVDDDPRAENRRWVVEIGTLGGDKPQRGSEFHLFEGDPSLIDYLQRFSGS